MAIITFKSSDNLFVRVAKLVGIINEKQDKDISLYSDIPLPLEDTDKLWINRAGTWYKVDNSEIGGESFVKKSFAQTSVDSITTGADASVPIPANGRSCIRLGNASLTSVACLNLSAIIGNSNAEVPYPGKIFEIMNGTGSDVEIKHATGADIQFTTKDGNSIIIPNNESLFVKYDADGLLELFRSWSESAYGKVYFINSSQNVTNAMHDRILIFTGNYTLTFVSGLRSDFKTVVTANNAVTGNFAFTGTTNSSESDGSILAGGGMCAIFQTNTNTFRLKGGLS